MPAAAPRGSEAEKLDKALERFTVALNQAREEGSW